MKTKFVLTGLVLLAVPSLIFIQSCKKDNLNPNGTNQTEAENNTKRTTGTFAPDDWNDNTLESNIVDFTDDIENNTVPDLIPEQANWYLEAAINYNNADYIVFDETETKEYTYQAAVLNGVIEGDDLLEIYDDVESDIIAYKSTLPTEIQNLLMVDSEIGVENDNATFRVSIIISNSANSLLSVNSGLHFDIRPTSGPGTPIMYKPASTSYAGGTPGCTVVKGTNTYMARRCNYLVSSNQAQPVTGTGTGSWVYSNLCSVSYSRRVIVSGSTVQLESNSSPVGNLSTSYPPAYNYQCLTRDKSKNKSTWCVDKNEANYYAEKAIQRASTSHIYTSIGIPLNKFPAMFEYNESYWSGSNFSLLWEVPYARYGRCINATPL
ncbi:MAG: hypothetical protein ACPGEG_02140 [Salibacteraceae bacterium]